MQRLLTSLRYAIGSMLVDLVIVHIAMVAALTVESAYRLQVGTFTVDAVWVVALRYYALYFTPLSPLFPAVFLVMGCYDQVSSHSLRGRLGRLLWANLAASMGFLAVNYFVFRHDVVSRAGLTAFVTFSGITLAIARSVEAVSARRLERIVRRESKNPPRRHVLVVGGAGYIGSLLVRKLLAAGYQVRILDLLVYGDSAIRDVLHHPHLELVVGDCRNIQDMVAAVKGTDVIVHLAAIVGDPACEQDRQTALEVNYCATRMLIQIAKGYGVQRFLFASSCSVYGASEDVMDEESTVQPVSLYGQTKLDAEQALLRARCDDFHPTILRFSTVFGLSHRPRFDLVVNLLIGKAAQEGIITIFNGDQWRPFIHVDDVANALMVVLKAPLQSISGQIFNVGDDQLNFTLKDIAGKIRNAFPGTRVEFVENSDRRNYRVSFEKIRRDLGFASRYMIEDGISELRRAIESGLVADYGNPHYSNQKHLKLVGPPAYRDSMDVRVMAAFNDIEPDMNTFRIHEQRIAHVV